MSVELDFADKLEIVTNYYGAGTIWERMGVDGLTIDQVNSMYDSLPGSEFTFDVSADGTMLGRQYANRFELPTVPGTDFDSNIPGGTYGGGNTFSGNVPANIDVDPNTGLPVRQYGGATTSGGSILPTIVDRVSLAVTGVNIGARLGLAIDNALYNIDPAWWDANLPTVNPQTWNSLVGVNPVGDFFLRTLFGINGNTMTGYIPENVLAYYYQMLRDAGVFGTGEYTASLSDRSRLPASFANVSSIPAGVPFAARTYSGTTYSFESSGGYGISQLVSAKNLVTLFVTDNPNDTVTLKTNGNVTGVRNFERSTRTINNNKQFWYYYVSFNPSIQQEYITPPLSPVAFYNVGQGVEAIGTYLFDGSVSGGSGVDGVNPIPNTSQYPPDRITGTTPQEVIQQLKEEYPDLFADPITERTVQPDGSITETVYVPIPWVVDTPTTDQPTTGEVTEQVDQPVNPETGDQMLPESTPDEPENPPATGDGDTPIPAMPQGSASSLWAVYNPSQGELNSFGAWLWSSNFVEQIKKLFNDPMQAILGVHKVFATPHTSGSQTIKCGYLDSGVSASVVSDQYTEVNCGSASLREYFGNVFDYSPHTRVMLFLPFIGIVPLDTAYVMRGSISVKYKVDVITGACIAEVNVTRDGCGGILYTYGGSAIVSYPISSGSYMGVVTSALTTALGVAAGVATGGMALPAAAGLALHGLTSAKTQVQHSGQFSGSSGAMGGKKPYLIVSRPQTRIAKNIELFSGIPSNEYSIVGDCQGFVKFKDVHIEISNAYEYELSEVESLLKTGIII